MLHLNPTLTPLDRAVTRCYQGVEKYIFRPFTSSAILCKSPIRYRVVPKADTALIVPTVSDAVPVLCVVGVRDSAHARRGAAPYADGSQRLVGPRSHGSLPSLGAFLECRVPFYATF